MKFIDTHAHYDDDKFLEDIDEVLNNVYNSDIDKIINVGINVKNSREIVNLARKYNNMYITIGVHPTEEVEENYIENLKEIYYSNKDIVVAIGEIGLDYYWEKEKKEYQKNLFINQIKLANELKLPIVVHCRDAGEDAVEILKLHTPLYGCVFHCYQPNDATAKYILENNMYISLTGNITFKRNNHFHEILEKIPLERIMLETDCPYMSPEPYRGRRNSSLNIPIIAQKLAELKGKSIEEIAEITYNNSIEFYKLK